MPCSGCGGSGHNIRTCASGPTPGGVNGMKARSGNSCGLGGSYFTPSFSTFSYSYDHPVAQLGPRAIERSSNQLFESNSFDSVQRDTIKNTEEKLSDVQKLVRKVDDKFEKQLEKYQEKAKEESKSMNKQLAKMELYSRKNVETFEKIMDEMEIAKRETIEHIDNKFKGIYESFISVEQKTKVNEEKIEKHTQEIGEIKELLVHVIENQEKEQTKYKPVQRKDRTSDQSDEETGELMSPKEMMKLTKEMITSLKRCRSKQDQFDVITALALKYINEE